MSEISKTADKALDILVVLSDGEATTPQQLSRRTGVNRTVVQRLLMTLLARGFVVKAGGEYSLAPRLGRLSEAVQPELRFAAHRPIAALCRKVEETIVLQVIDDDRVVVLIEQVPSSEIALQVRHEVGSRSPMVNSASGLAVLAWLSGAAWDRVVSEAHDDTLPARLEQVREAGYAMTSSELRDGVSGLAAPLRMGGEVVGSVAILVPAPRESELPALLTELQRCARRIESALS